MLTIQLAGPASGSGNLGAVFERGVEQWRAGLERIAPDLPTDWALAWIYTESRGKYDAESSSGEHGLFQVSLTEALTYLKLTQAEFDRILTDPDWSLETGVRLARMYIPWAKRLLASRGLKWNARDFWTLVRMQHGGVGIAKDLMDTFIGGPPPTTWAQYRTAVVQLDPEVRGYAGRVLANAEYAGQFVSNRWRPRRRATTVAWVVAGGVIVVAAATGIAYAAWRRAA